MYKYAQVNDNGEVFSINDLSEEMVRPDLIPISDEMYNNPKILICHYVGQGQFKGFYFVLEVDKPTIKADGQGIATITATVYDWQDNVATDYADPISFELNGQDQTVVPDNGVANITFSSTVSGEYLFNISGNKYTKPNQIKVVVTNA